MPDASNPQAEVASIFEVTVPGGAGFWSTFGTWPTEQWCVDVCREALQKADLCGRVVKTERQPDGSLAVLDNRGRIAFIIEERRPT